jgi:hypothetical protein
MIRKFAVVSALAAAVAMSSIVIAEEYVDYAPQKGMWRIVAVEVDPNHVDDYLTGLRKSQMPALEVLKSRGLIDQYRFLVRDGYSKGQANVLIQTHLPDAALLNPDKARDMAVQKEIYARFPKEQGDAAVAGYEKYRQFLGQSLWNEVVMTK